MSNGIDPQITNLLKFNPKLWWDPIPFWFLEKLDVKVIGQLGSTQLELQRDVLQAQLKATERSMEILKGAIR